MAIVEVKVPQLSESVAEATMLTWKKKAGEAVAADEILIEIETDKVVLEVPAPSAGVLAELVVGDGGTVVSDQVIAKIDTEGKAGAAAPAAAPAAAAAAPAAAVAAVAAPAAGGSKGDVAMPAAAMCHGPPSPEPEADCPPAFTASTSPATEVTGLSLATVTPAGISASSETRSKLAGVMSARPTVWK